MRKAATPCARRTLGDRRSAGVRWPATRRRCARSSLPAARRCDDPPYGRICPVGGPHDAARRSTFCRGGLAFPDLSARAVTSGQAAPSRAEHQISKKRNDNSLTSAPAGHRGHRTDDSANARLHRVRRGTASDSACPLVQWVVNVVLPAAQRSDLPRYPQLVRRIERAWLVFRKPDLPDCPAAPRRHPGTSDRYPLRRL